MSNNYNAGKKRSRSPSPNTRDHTSPTIERRGSLEPRETQRNLATFPRDQLHTLFHNLSPLPEVHFTQTEMSTLDTSTHTFNVNNFFKNENGDSDSIGTISDTSNLADNNAPPFLQQKFPPAAATAAAKYTAIIDEASWNAYLGDSTQIQKRNKIDSARKWTHAHQNDASSFLQQKFSPAAAAAKYTPIIDEASWNAYLGDSTQIQKRNKIRNARQWTYAHQNDAPPFLQQKFFKNH